VQSSPLFAVLKFQAGAIQEQAAVAAVRFVQDRLESVPFRVLARLQLRSRLATLKTKSYTNFYLKGNLKG
jgi:hypothetical protein